MLVLRFALSQVVHTTTLNYLNYVPEHILKTGCKEAFVLLHKLKPSHTFYIYNKLTASLKFCH